MANHQYTEEHNWTTHEPITQEKMNNLEGGVATAHERIDGLYTKQEINTQISNLTSAISQAQTTANNALSTANTADGKTDAGNRAWTYVAGAMTFNQETDEVTKSLDSRLDEDEANIASVSANAALVNSEVTTARGQLIHTGNSAAATSLKAKLDDMDTQIQINKGAIGSTQADFTSAKTNAAGTVYGSLQARLNQADADFNTLKGEIETARDESASLNARLDAIDNSSRPTRTLPNVITEINDAHRDTNDTLDARFDSIDGGTAPSRTLPDVISEVNGAHRGNVSGDTLNQRFGMIETNLSNINTNLGYDDLSSTETIQKKINDAVTSLETRIDLIDNASTGTVAGLDTRISALETEVDMTSTNSRIDDALSRIDAIDNVSTGAIKGINDKINTIAGELAMVDNGAIVDTNTKIDQLEGNLETLATELGMVQSGQIVDTNTRIDALDNAVNDSTSGLAATKAIADAAATNADLVTLAGRVTTLEGASSSSTIIIENVTYDANGMPTSIGATPSADVDYLLKNGDKYYYWKYINNSWELISGGESGGGTSSAEFYAALPLSGEDNIDYFIGSGTNYVHYRYHNNAWVTVLPAHLINSVTVDTSAIGEGEAITHKSRPVIKEMGSETNLLANFNAIQSFAADTLPNNEGYKLTWVNIDGESNDITITGGGGGGSSSITASINRITDGSLTTVSGEPCVISYKLIATDNEGESLSTTCTATWSINRVRVATETVEVNDANDDNDFNSFNITPYLHTGDNNITLTITIVADDQTITRTKTWTAQVVNFSLDWEYNESTVQDGENIEFSCTPYGLDITKTLHVKIGQLEQTQTVTTSGIPVTVVIPNNFEHGSYTAEMWMTAAINEQSKETTHVSHEFIVVEAGETAPVIAATLPSATMDQYDSLTIPFVVYSPNANTSTVVLAVDGTVIDTRTDVGRAQQKWIYTPTTAGEKVLTITCGTTVKTLNLTVNAININNAEVPSYAFKLKASDFASNNALKDWYYDGSDQINTKLQFSNNFDWINGGLQTEVDENYQLRQYIRVKSGTTMTIPYKMFAEDPRATGSNFKIIFKIDKCRDYDAVALTNVADNVGIEIGAHKATFSSSTTSISTQYGEEEYTELEFEVYKAKENDGITDTVDPFMLAWIDGVMTTARPYGSGSFTHQLNNQRNIVIGSNNCDICVYLVKYYNKALSRDEHVINFIADAPNAVEMKKRYNRNNILTDGEIDHKKLAVQNPDCRIWLYDIEKMPTSKDKAEATNVYNFQQIWTNGTQYDQLVASNAKLTIQGTSSVNYRKGAANTDINFGLEGTTLEDGLGNNLLDDNLELKGFKLNANSLPITYANTKVNFASCEQVNNMCNAEWYQKFQPYPSLSTRDCMEFVTGVQFIKDRGENEASGEVRLFNEKPNRNSEKYYMYSIANMGTSKKNTHIFHSDDECCIEVMANTSKGERMLEWPADLDWSGKVEGKDHSFEIRYAKKANENAAKAGWQRFIEWMASYNLSPYNAETNPNGYTNAPLINPDTGLARTQEDAIEFAPYTFRGHNRPVTATSGRNFEQVLRNVTVNQYAGKYTHDTFNYRMAKMLSECEDYMAMDSVVYHFCFIERHTMVDNVAKNTFWSADLTNQYINGVEQDNTSGYWIWDLSKNYDNDTADGNNNEGQLVFDYGNEATDTYGAKTVFNAADSVWFIFISNLYEACRAMFSNREAKGAWDAQSYHNYLLQEQRKIPERVWNECYWYDYLRTYENGIDTSWLTFLDGGQKVHQRKHFETYEELYDASKYMSPLSTSNIVTLRGYTPPAGTWAGVQPKTEFQVKMYNKCYLTIHVDDAYKQVKCAKGSNNTISFYTNNDPAQGYITMNDAVIKLDTAQMIQEIGDLSCLYPGSSSFSSAKRLRVLQIGSNETGYTNPNLTSTEQLIFINPMLEELGLQNLPLATYELNLSSCPELRVLDASGSGFTGFEFANGGLLSEAYVNTPISLVMRNLDYLTNANFHLTSPTSVTSLRLEGGQLFDNYAFITQLTNLNTLRVSGINWTLQNLTLLDTLLGLMGMNAAGQTTAQSYLAGTVTLYNTVHEGKYNSYMAAWSPDLTIDVSHSNFIQQHLVTYKYEDGTVFYSTYINHGSPVIDPYTAGLTGQPTKAADIQSTYIFGELDNTATYLPFSGWRLSSDSQSIYNTYGGTTANVPVNGALEVYTVFTSVPQQYIVRWMLDENSLVYATPSGQNYGGGYNLIAPTIKDVQAAFPDKTYTFNVNGNNCTYSIMTGWQKTPANITPTTVGSTYDIYPTWIERENVPYTTVLNSNDYSIAEKLLVLKHMASARSSLAIADKYQVQMGYNGAKPGHNLVNNPTRFNGSATVINEYTPFAAGKDFTIAIDYRFEPRELNGDEAVLFSCYSEDGDSKQGFKLFYNLNGVPVPQISFGDTSMQSTTNVRVIGSRITDRNVVVLRHKANDPTLYIYCGSSAEGQSATYDVASFRKTVSWSSIASNAKIVLGGTNVTSNTSMVNAPGTIYFAKYWEEDLGESECLQLANWCHETITFAVSDFDGAAQHSAINGTLTAKVVLHALTATQMGTVAEPQIDRGTNLTIGWDPSTVRDFYNNRIYLGFPTDLQSVLIPISVAHRKANYDTNDNGYKIATSGTSVSEDYVFAPSCVELGETTGTHSIEAAGAFSWFSGSQISVKQYNGGFVDVSGNANYTNLRFPYRANELNRTITIYTGYPSTGSSFYTWMQSNIGVGSLHSGDILIPENSSVAYIYVEAGDVSNGAPLTTSTESFLANTIGGWVESVDWWTRSVPNQSYASGASKFIYVSTLGSLVADSNKNHTPVYSIAV